MTLPVETLSRDAAIVALHVCPGDLCAGQQWHPEMTNVLDLEDPLHIGPSVFDPVEHVEVRIRYWREQFAFLRKYGGSRPRKLSPSECFLARAKTCLAKTSPRVPIVIWTTPYHYLELWWSLFVLNDLGYGKRRLFLGNLGIEGPDTICPALLEDKIAHLAPVDHRMMEKACELWRAFTSPSPKTFLEACQRGAEEFPEIDRTARLYASFFQRSDDKGNVRLSLFDEGLFTAFSETKWLTVLNVVDTYMANEISRHFLKSLDFVSRLLQWYDNYKKSEHRPFDVEDSTGCNLLTQRVFRLTKFGRQLQTEGLASMTDAPPLPIGGSVAYRDEINQ